MAQVQQLCLLEAGNLLSRLFDRSPEFAGDDALLVNGLLRNRSRMGDSRVGLELRLEGRLQRPCPGLLCRDAREVEEQPLE